MNIVKTLHRTLLDEKGMSLIAMAFMITISGLFIGAGSRIYDTWDMYRSAALTDTKMDTIQKALESYYAINGRYPCPAPLDAAVDDAAGTFGREVALDCTAAAAAGTFRAAGRDGRMVRTGTIPVRTLGLADSFMMDGYDHRLIYSVTESYAVQGTITTGDEGGIFVHDSNDAAATATDGTVVQIVYSMGWDTNGVYNVSGVQLQACDAALISGENCDYDANAVFRNTLNKSTNQNNLFVTRMTYGPNKTGGECTDDNINTDGMPKDTVFLVDTSGSMGFTGKADQPGGDGFEVKCPESMPGCSRIDVARWAMRRVMPSVVYQNTQIGSEESGKTSFTGFLQSGASVTSNAIAGKLNNTDISFFKPDELSGDHDGDSELNDTDKDYIDSKTAALEGKMNSMCPSGGTPLGVHIKALADQLGDGDEKRPNKITIISDGLSNDGDGNGTGGKYDPIAAANYIKATYPNVKVDIIDIVGNPALLEVSEITGGSYYRSDNPDALLKSLYSSMGVCQPYAPTPPVDQGGCGSGGDWWKNN